MTPTFASTADGLNANFLDQQEAPATNNAPVTTHRATSSRPTLASTDRQAVLDGIMGEDVQKRLFDTTVNTARKAGLTEREAVIAANCLVDAYQRDGLLTSEKTAIADATKGEPKNIAEFVADTYLNVKREEGLTPRIISKMEIGEKLTAFEERLNGLETKVTVLEAEKVALTQQLTTAQARIQELEAQLAQSQASLADANAALVNAGITVGTGTEAGARAYVTLIPNVKCDDRRELIRRTAESMDLVTQDGSGSWETTLKPVFEKNAHGFFRGPKSAEGVAETAALPKYGLNPAQQAFVRDFHMVWEKKASKDHTYVIPAEYAAFMSPDKIQGLPQSTGSLTGAYVPSSSSQNHVDQAGNHFQAPREASTNVTQATLFSGKNIKLEKPVSDKVRDLAICALVAEKCNDISGESARRVLDGLKRGSTLGVRMFKSDEREAEVSVNRLRRDVNKFLSYDATATEAELIQGLHAFYKYGNVVPEELNPHVLAAQTSEMAKKQSQAAYVSPRIGSPRDLASSS